MTNAKDIAYDLLKRLLSGERGNIPLFLAMLLEKSSPLDSGDAHYREILPPDLAELRLDSNTVSEIIAALSSEVARNPESPLLFALSTTGSPDVTRLLVKLLIEPPRPLTVREYTQALGIVASYLPYRLSQDPQFLPPDVREGFMHTLNKLHHSEDASVREHVERVLKRLRLLGAQVL